MSIIYVDSNASGADSGASWANAYATLQQALTAWTTSDEVWVELDHTESYSTTQTLTCGNSTFYIRCRIYRVDSATNLYSPPPQDTTTTDNFIQTLTTVLNIDFHAEIYGLKFNLSWYYQHGSAYSIKLEDMEIALGSSVNNARLYINRLVKSLCINCYFRNTLTTGTVLYASGISNGVYIGCTFNIASHSNGFIDPANGVSASGLTFIDCDLSLLTNTLLVDTSKLTISTVYTEQVFKFINCKLKSTYTLTDGTFDAINGLILLDGCSANAGTNILNRRVTFLGDVDTNASVYFDSGYKDLNSNNLSQIFTPDVSTILGRGIESFPINGIIESTGSKTFTLELVENYTVALTERECYLELYYFDSASNTHHKVDTSTKQFAKSSYTALTAGSGLGNWTAEPSGSRSVKLEVATTVNKIGHYYGVVHLEKYEAGKVLHIDNKFTVT